MTLPALSSALPHLILGFVPLDVPPPGQQFGFLPILALALLAIVILVGVVVFTRRRKGRK